jgi:tetratricopeptide (TPR) repeat protein
MCPLYFNHNPGNRMKLLSKAIFIILLINITTILAQESVEVPYIAKAQYLMQRGNYPSAILYLDSALAIGEDKKLSYEMRGICNLYTEKFLDAERDFTLLIQQDTTYADAYNNRSLARASLHKTYDALYDASVAIELDSMYAEAFLNRGTILREMGDEAQALKDFERVTMLDPMNPSAYYFLGEMYANREDLKSAATNYQKAIDLGLNSTKINYTLGNIQFKLEDYQKAIENYSLILQSDPGDLDARNNRAMAYEKIGKTKEAASDKEYLAGLTEVLYPDIKTLKFAKFQPTTKEISIELPDSWAIFESVDSNVTDIIISKEDINQQGGYFKSGVRITINKNMTELAGVTNKDELLGLWEETAGDSQKDYYHYKLYNKKTFPKYPYTGVQHHISVQYTADSPRLSMYEYVIAKDDMLIIGIFQCGIREFNYYKEIFDKAIKTLILP